MIRFEDLHRHRFSHDQLQALLPQPLHNYKVNSYNVYRVVNHLYETLCRQLTVSIPTETEIRDFRDKNDIPIGSLFTRAIFIHLVEEALRTRCHPKPKETISMSKPNQLFRVIGSNPEVYVTLLATDSSNKSVVEEKGTGKIFSIEPNKLEKVLPYTVGVKFMTGATVYNYLTSANKVKKNDVLVCTRNGTLSFAVITEVDTKSEQATATLEDSFDSVLSTKDLK